MNYGWILLENLNNGLQPIFGALLVLTVFAGFIVFTDRSLEKEEEGRGAHQKRQYFRWLVVSLLLLGTVLVLLPNKNQITVLRGESLYRTEPVKETTTK